MKVCLLPFKMKFYSKEYLVSFTEPDKRTILGKCGSVLKSLATHSNAFDNWSLLLLQRGDIKSEKEKNAQLFSNESSIPECMKIVFDLFIVPSQSEM